MKIAIHTFDGMTMFHLAAPLLVFGEVGRLHFAADWEARVFTDAGQPVRSAEGYVMGDVYGPDIVRDADLVVLSSWLARLPAGTVR